jgi:putative MATE family efflux protein
MDEKQFGILPSKTIFKRFVIPSIVSMLFSSLYVIADGIFVGKLIGAEALAAVNVIMPILAILFATSNMIAVGSSVNVSIALGKKDFSKANQIFSTCLLAITVLGIIIVAIFMIFEDPILTLLIKDASLRILAKEYLNVFIYFLPLAMPLFAMDNFTRACGKAKYNMYVNISVSVLNIFLDFVFLYIFRKGISYAALASCLSMMVGVVFLYAPFISKKNTITFAKPDLPIREMISIINLGVSDFLNSAAGGIMGIFINILLLKYGGTNGIASYGIIMYINSLLFSIIYGMSDSIIPAISYNYGAGNMEKTKELFVICRKFAVTIAVFLFIILEIFPSQAAAIFIKNSNKDLIYISTIAIRITAISYFFASMNIVYNSFMIAFNMARLANFLMILKAIIFPILSIIIFTYLFDLYGIFLSITFSAIITFVFSSIFWNRAKDKIKEI